MSESLIDGLRRFQREVFPDHRDRFRTLVAEGQDPGTLFIGCSDSRVLPGLLTDAGPGELFVVRNVGAFVPPHEPGEGLHATAAAVEYAVEILEVADIVVCGHSHCGAVRALYDPPEARAPALERWLRMTREARLDEPPDERILRRTERRSIALQLERLADYPSVRSRTEEGRLALHGWHYLLEEGRVEVLDPERGEFRPIDGP